MQTNPPLNTNFCQNKLLIWCSLGLSTIKYAQQQPFLPQNWPFTHDSFSKYCDTALWYWTQSVMKCASIKKAARKDFNGHIQNLSTFIALCLESHWLSWELYLACFQFLQSKEFFPSYVQYAWNNLGYEEEWIQPVCISLIHRYALEKPRFGQLFVHYFKCLQAEIAALPKRSCDVVSHVHTFCLHSWVLAMTLQNSGSFFPPQ